MMQEKKNTPLCLGKRKLARVHPNTRGVWGEAVRRTVTFKNIGASE